MAVNEELWVEFRAKMDDFFGGVEKGKKAQRDFEGEVKKSLQQIDALYGVLGQGPEMYGAKVKAVSSEIKKAIASGLTPQSDAVAKLTNQYKALKTELDANTKAQRESALASKQAASDALEAQKKAAAASKEAKQASEQMMKSQKQSFTDMAAKAYIAYQAVKQLANVVNQGFEFNQLIENSQTAFTVMLGSAERASSMMADLTKLSMTTPIGLGEAAESTKQMLAFGFATENMVDNLKMLGTVAGAINKPLDDLVYIYGTLRTQGQAYTRDIMQFAMRGIPIYEALGEVMGVPASQVRKLTEDGKVGFAEVERAFKKMTGEGGIFAGMLEKRMQTLSGSLDIMRKQLLMTLGSLTQASSGPLRAFADAVTSAFRGDGAAFSGIGKDLRATFSAALGVIKDSLPAIISGISLVVSLVKDIASGPLGMVAGMFLRLLGVLIQVANFLRGPLGVALSAFLAAKLWMGLGAALQFVVTQMRATAVASIAMATSSNTAALGFARMATSIKGATRALTRFMATPAGLALLAVAGAATGVAIAMQDVQDVEDAAAQRKEQAQSLDPYARRTAIVEEMKATGASAHANYSASDNANFVQYIATKLRIHTMEAAKIAFEEGFIEPATYTKMQSDMQKIQESGKVWQTFLSHVAERQAFVEGRGQAVAEARSFSAKQSLDIYEVLGIKAPDNLGGTSPEELVNFTSKLSSEALASGFHAEVMAPFLEELNALKDIKEIIGLEEFNKRANTIAENAQKAVSDAIVGTVIHNKKAIVDSDKYTKLPALLGAEMSPFDPYLDKKKAPKKKEEQDYISWLAREWETKITETRLDDIELQRDKDFEAAKQVYDKRMEIASKLSGGEKAIKEEAAMEEYGTILYAIQHTTNMDIAAEKMRVESEFQDYMAQGQAQLSGDKMAMIQAEYNMAIRAEEAKMQAVKDTTDEERKRIDAMSALRIKNIEEVKRLAIEAEQASQFEQRGQLAPGASQRIYAAAQRGLDTLATAAKEAAAGISTLSSSASELINAFGAAALGTIAKSSAGQSQLGQYVQGGVDSYNKAYGTTYDSVNTAGQEKGLGKELSADRADIAAKQAGGAAALGDMMAMAGTDFLTSIMDSLMAIESFAETVNWVDTIVKSAFEVFGGDIQIMFKPLSDMLKMIGQAAGLIIEPFIQIGVILIDVLYPVLVVVIAAVKIVAAAFTWFSDYVIVPIANTMVDAINGFVDGINAGLSEVAKIFGVHIDLIPRLERLQTSLEKAAAAANKVTKQKEMELALDSITDTIDYLNDKLKTLVDKQIESAQDMYEVGAITAKQYEAIVAEANKNLPTDKNVLPAALLAESIPAIKKMLETLGTEKTWYEAALEKFKEDGITPVLNSLETINGTLLGILVSVGTETEKKVAADALAGGGDGSFSTGGGRSGSGAAADAQVRAAQAEADAQARAAQAEADMLAAKKAAEDTFYYNYNWWSNYPGQHRDKTHAREYLTSAENYAAYGGISAQTVQDIKDEINRTGAYYHWSLATGTANVPRDNVAQIHQGEGIIPEPFMDSIRKGDLYLGKNQSRSQESGTIIQVSVDVQGSVQSEDNLAISIANAIDRGRRRGIITV